MRCPYCGEPESKVLDSRPTEEGAAIRRRRECQACGRRFTTYEKVEELPLVVIKKDGRRESFDRVKLLNGLLRACEKRPIPLAKLEALVEDIERQLRNRTSSEVDSREVGELAMEKLRDMDEVAYVRFASVYRSFKDINDINRFLEQLQSLVQRRS
ncbi:MAG: transcriptional regulator NrdR [Bacillota bacterium]